MPSNVTATPLFVRESILNVNTVPNTLLENGTYFTVLSIPVLELIHFKVRDPFFEMPCMEFFEKSVLIYNIAICQAN